MQPSNDGGPRGFRRRGPESVMRDDTTMLYLVIGFLLGLAAAALWRFLCDCLTGWMDDPIPERYDPD